MLGTVVIFDEVSPVDPSEDIVSVVVIGVLVDSTKVVFSEDSTDVVVDSVVVSNWVLSLSVVG